MSDLLSRVSQQAGAQTQQAQSQPQAAAPELDDQPQRTNPGLLERVKAHAQSTQPSQGSSPQHGSLYNAADKFLNPTEQTSMLGKIGDAATGGLGRGALKGALSTAAGIGSAFNKVTGSNQPFNQDNLSGLTEAHGAGENVGKFGEQMGEFAGGEGALKGFGLAGKMAAGGLVSGAQTGGSTAATAIGALLPGVLETPVVKKAGELASKWLGAYSGAGSDAIKRAFMNPQSNGLSKVMRGEWNVNDVVKNIETSITAYRDAASAKYSQALEQIKKTSIPQWHANAGKLMQDVNDTVDKELGKFGLKEFTNAKGNLALDTRYYSGQDKEKAVDLWKLVRGWGKVAEDMTPSGLDSLKKQIANYAGEGGQVGALATRLNETLREGLNKTIPGYEKMTAEYRQAQETLKDFKDALNVKAAPGTNNENTITGKIQNLFKQNTNYRELVMKKLPNGEDLLDQVAGLHLNDVMPKGLRRAFVGTETLLGWHYLSSNPAALAAAAAASSPRVVGETARAAGKIAQSKLPIASTVRQAAQAGKDQLLSSQ